MDCPCCHTKDSVNMYNVCLHCGINVLDFAMKNGFGVEYDTQDNRSINNDMKCCGNCDRFKESCFHTESWMVCKRWLYDNIPYKEREVK